MALEVRAHVKGPVPGIGKHSAGTRLDEDKRHPVSPGGVKDIQVSSVRGKAPGLRVECNQ